MLFQHVFPPQGNFILNRLFYNSLKMLENSCSCKCYMTSCVNCHFTVYLWVIWYTIYFILLKMCCELNAHSDVYMCKAVFSYMLGGYMCKLNKHCFKKTSIHDSFDCFCPFTFIWVSCSHTGTLSQAGSASCAASLSNLTHQFCSNPTYSQSFSNGLLPLCVCSGAEEEPLFLKKCPKPPTSQP